MRAKDRVDHSRIDERVVARQADNDLGPQLIHNCQESRQDVVEWTPPNLVPLVHDGLSQLVIRGIYRRRQHYVVEPFTAAYPLKLAEDHRHPEKRLENFSGQPRGRRPCLQDR
jgi:hypothetical protein